MLRDKKRQAIEWLKKQSHEDQKTIAIAAIERLMEIEEVCFRSGDEESEACIFWESCGDDLRDP